MTQQRAPLACLVLLSCGLAAPLALAETQPAIGTKVSGKLSLGRNTLVLPPGDWEVIWSGAGTTGMTGDGAKNPTARLALAQRDEAGGQVKAILYHVASLVSIPGTTSWNTNSCDTSTALHKSFSGNFKFPECLIIDYWMAPNATSTGFNKTIWDWSVANNLKLPTTFVVARFVKYQGGDYVQTHVSLNPDAFGLPESSKRDRDSSEWNATQLKTDSLRSAYIEQVTKWGGALADQARPTVGGGTPALESLPAFPRVSK